MDREKKANTLKKKHKKSIDEQVLKFTTWQLKGDQMNKAMRFPDEKAKLHFENEDDRLASNYDK